MLNLLAHVIFVMTSVATVTVTAPAQLSVATTAPVFAGGTRLAHCTVTFAGQVIVGGVLSKTVIVWAQVPELPHASTAEYTRVIVNLFAQVIFVITSGATVTVEEPPQLSVTVTAPVFGGGTSA